MPEYGNQLASISELELNDWNKVDLFSLNIAAISLNRYSDGKYVMVNERFVEKIGYRRDELLGKTSVEIGIWLSCQERLDFIRQLSQAGRIENGEFQFRTKSGEIITQLWSVELVKIGGESYVLGFAQDITEQKNLELQLHKEISFNRLRADISHTLLSPTEKTQELCMLVLSDLQDRMEIEQGYVAVVDPIVGKNHVYSYIMPYQEATKSFTKLKQICFVQANDKDALQLRNYSVYAGKSFFRNSPNESFSFQLPGFPEYVGKWYNLLFIPIVAGHEILGQIVLGNRVGGFTKNDIDLLETLADSIALAFVKWQHDQALVETLEKYRALFENANDAVYLYAITEQGEPNCFLEVNHIACERLGYNKAELLNLTIDEILAEEGRATELKEWFTKLQPGESCFFETTHKSKEGKRIPVEVSSKAFINRGSKLILSIARDITERKRTEAMIKRRQEQMNYEMVMAGKLQRELLSPNFRNDCISIETIYEPYLMVSGDYFYHGFSQAQNSLKGYVIDVTGHGMATALQTSAINMLFRETMDKNLTCSEKIRQINEKSCCYFSNEAFCAAIYFEIDFSKKVITYVSAGINLFLSATNLLQGVVKAEGALLGIDTNFTYHQHSIAIQPGNTFYFMTDGLFDLLQENEKNADMYEFADVVKNLISAAKRSERWDDAAAVCLQIK